MNKLEKKSIELESNLLHSHFLVAVLGIFMLIIGASASLWLRGYALDLATVSGPKLQSINKLQTALQQSVSNLRAWMSINDKEFMINRKNAWDNNMPILISSAIFLK
ncbi:MAG: hypothetical protein COA33_007490 [Fluviicola sp.]|nr:hypothetical protein [Fluviicola sp.]